MGDFDGGGWISMREFQKMCPRNLSEFDGKMVDTIKEVAGPETASKFVIEKEDEQKKQVTFEEDEPLAQMPGLAVARPKKKRTNYELDEDTIKMLKEAAKKS